MQILYISNELTHEVVQNFIRDYNCLDLTKSITIYIKSVGGLVGHYALITHIINSNYKNVTLVAVDEIFSSAFNIFFSFKGKRIILPDTIGMAHFCWSTFQLDERGKPSTDYDKFIMAEMKRNKSKTIKNFQDIGLNTKEVNKIKNSKDCYFTTERLNELLTYGKKNRS